MKKIIVFTLLLFPIFAKAQDTNYVWTLRLDPKTAHVWINDTLPLRIVAEAKNKTTNELAGTNYGSGWSFGPSVTPHPPICTVNGIVNGNNEVGQIIINGPNSMAFKAPWRKPDKNPVEVKAVYKDVNIYGVISDITMTCNFQIQGGWTIRLDPDTAWLRVNDTLPLSAVLDFENKNETITIGRWIGSGVTPNLSEWTVNGIVNGNNLVGQIIMNGPYVTFKAPISKPVKNPVEVIAVYRDVELYVGSISDRKLTSTIYIVDSVDNSEDKGGKTDTILVTNKDPKQTYEVRMVASLKGGSNASWGGVITYNDAGSFKVAVEGEKAVLTDIQNNLEVLTTNCAMIITNPTTNTGMLHVVAAKSIKVTPPNPPGQRYPIVEIWFVPHPTELTKFKFTCPPPPSARKSSIGKIDHSQMAMMAMARMPALPPYIKFIAKNEEQIIIEKGTPGGELYYKFSVRKVKED